MNKWKDKSSFSRDDQERTPNCFEARFGGFKLVVHHHIYYPKDQWLATCHPELFTRRELQSKDLAEAQREAISMLRAELEKAWKEINE